MQVNIMVLLANLGLTQHFEVKSRINEARESCASLESSKFSRKSEFEEEKGRRRCLKREMLDTIVVRYNSQFMSIEQFREKNSHLMDKMCLFLRQIDMNTKSVHYNQKTSRHQFYRFELN